MEKYQKLMVKKLEDESYYVVIKEDVFDGIIGRVMQQIEILGLPEKQEHALKSNIKKTVRHMQDELGCLVRNDVWEIAIKDGFPTSNQVHA